MSPAAKTRTRVSAQQRELQILHAATVVFARSNYRQASVAEIAREVGVTEPAIYRYFPSKKDLFIRILERIGERILELWREGAARERGDAVSVLKRLGQIYLDSARTHSDHLKIQFQALAESDDPDIARQLRENHKAYVGFLAEVIERGKSEDVIRRDVDSYAAAWLLNSVGFTLTLVRLVGFERQLGARRVEEMITSYADWLAGSSEQPPPAGAIP
jgi:TetR/AcrR family transcriptional regulator